MPRRVLVLGGSGFVGGHVAARLVEAGDFVVVPTRRRASARALLLLPTIDVVEADIHDRNILAGLLGRVDTVINLVGILHENPRETFRRVHVDLVASVIAACRHAGVRRLIHMSALNAAPDAPSHYLRTKGEGEALVADSGLDWTIMRPSVIFGRGDSFLGLFAKLMRFLPVMALASSDARFQPVHVGDVAHCFVQSTGDDRTIRERYDLCGPKSYSLRELVAWVGETTGHVRPIIPLPAGLGRLQARLLELLPGKLMTRDNLASMTCASVCRDSFPALFGREPVALEAVVPEYLAPSAFRRRYDAFRAGSGR